MEKYEKTIGLKTIKLTLIRQWLGIICIFIPIAIASLITTSAFSTKTYSATTSMTRSAAFTSETVYNQFTNKVSATISTVVETLTAKHSNGKAITASEITSGLSYSKYSAGSFKSTLTFKTTDKIIVQPVLTAITEYCVSQKDEVAEFKGLTSTAVSGVTTSSNQKKYLLIALAAGVVVSLGVPFLFEIFGDEIYDKNDIESLGGRGFELCVSKKKENSKNEKDQFGDIQL